MFHSGRSWAAGCAAAVMAMLAVTMPARAQDSVEVPLDTETTVNGIEVACTGIGQMRDDPRWAGYPVRIEFAEPDGAYLADESLTISPLNGPPLLSVHCEGPWILMKLPAGRVYRAEGKLAQAGMAVSTGLIKPPAHGQTRFVLPFRKAG